MKLKDLIGVIPRSEQLLINSDLSICFGKVDWSLLNREVIKISALNWGCISIELQD